MTDRAGSFALCAVPVRLALVASLAFGASAALAQDRTSDNAITQAEDAFGFSIGRESVGIYSASNARGFSPTAAGNVRIEGLYFDPEFGLTNALTHSVSIKVGITAQGYPFSAPSGVVDYSLTRPTHGSSAIANADSYGSYGLELDGSIPVSPALGLGYGITGFHTEFFDGTSDFSTSETVIARWQPRSGVEIIPFWTLVDDLHNEISPSYVPAGEFLPPVPQQRRFVGPPWAAIRTSGTNHGILANAAIGEDWLIRFGAFRSVLDFKRNFTSILADEQPDGTGDHIIIADPRQVDESISGELRVTHSIADGPRLHVVHVSLRERDAHRQFGGSDQADFGPGRVDQPFHPREPDFSFGPLSRDHVQQATLGVAYDGRWKNVGELGFSLARAFYRKATSLPGQPIATSPSSPWLYDATLAQNVAHNLVVYAGYARGLEENGVAPPNASNRNEPLPAIITEQKDAGFRLSASSKLRLVAGVFDLTRPNFGLDQTNDFLQVGTTHSRGAEFSFSGGVTPRLNVLIGGVFLDARVTAAGTASGRIGPRPAGTPGHIVNASVDWQTTFLPGLELDLAIYQRGTVPGTTDNVVIIPRWTNLNLGARYHFALARHPATLRLQLTNAFGQTGLVSQGPGIYGFNPGRSVAGTLTLDG
jgi:iron complex outermembrane receptor protein